MFDERQHKRSQWRWTPTPPGGKAMEGAANEDSTLSAGLADGVTEANYSYFRLCLGDSYTPRHYGQHEGRHPKRVREAMEALAGRPEADVLAALVTTVEVERQRYALLLADYEALTTKAEVKGAGDG